ncbi:DNA polymerase III subunit beta [Ligaoa zhengdingensis]|uniref:DNA polymerase III subunit beta n=1 Tax=Ligaoa zhengdingensis TaxID=2763658 RepID=UPI0020165B94
MIRLKFNCDRNELFEVISNVSRAVSPKSTLAALEGILLRAQSGRLYLSGYDLDMGMSASIEANVAEEGEIVLTAKLFVDMIRRMAGERVSIESDAKLLTEIKCGLTEFTILGIPSEEFPELPAVTGDEGFSLPQNMLKSMIDQTLFAIATNDTKPVHTGSLFEMDDNELSVVSVDGFRLALRREKLAGAGEASFVVPGKTLSEISKLLDGESDELVEVSHSRKHIIFQVSGYAVVSRLLEGEFLDYKAAIPPAEGTVVTVSKRALIESVERTSLLISDRLKSPLRVKFDGECIKMSCSTAIGKAYDELTCKIEGPPVEMGFNNRYLLDALRASDCDEVRLVINGPLSPMKMLPPDGENFLFLVLPVRLKAE